MEKFPVVELLAAAREGARHAFLTKPHGTRYGAAVWTTSGRIHRAGQYSSFNHSTNIHAEMGALAVATAAGDVDVRALALVSTSCRYVPARPCGVCRQVILEHARRTGSPIHVFMASWDGRVVERMTSDELLPVAWKVASEPRSSPWTEPDPPSRDALRFGDLVEVRTGVLGMVWHPSWWSSRAWIGLTHEGSRELPSMASAWEDYQHELRALGLGEATSWGDRFVLVDHCSAPRIPMQPLSSVGIPRVRALLDILQAAGVCTATIKVTGVHASGMAREDSVIALVINTTPHTIVRRVSSVHQVSVIWRDEGAREQPRASAIPRGKFITSRGRVTTIESLATPTQWQLTTEQGALIQVETWHGDGMLLDEDDEVEIAGVELEHDGRVVQFSLTRDGIRWIGLEHT